MTPTRQRHYVQSVSGQQVEIIVRDDLDEIKNILLRQLSNLTRWLIGTGLVGAFALGFWAASLRAELNTHAEAIASISVNGSTPVQAIRTDMATLREQMAALREQMDDLKRALERRGR